MNLNELYEQLLSGEMSSEKGMEIMQSPDIRKMISVYINKSSINKLVPYSEQDIQDIMLLVKIAQFIYNDTGMEAIVPDSDYDTLYQILLENGGADITSAPITPNSGIVDHHAYPSLRGTLTKIYYLTNDEKRTNPSRKYLDEWKSSMENKIFNNSGKRVNLDNEEIYVFPKFDGISVVFEFDDHGIMTKALTRGYTATNEAKNVTHHFQYRHDIGEPNYHPNKPYGLKTEVMMQNKDLEKFNKKYRKDYKNTRSIVSAIINSDDYDEDKARLLHIVPLRIGDEDNQELSSRVFTDYPYIRCQLKDREKIREFALEHRFVNKGLRCDGAVIYIINPEIQEILGRENDKNNFEVAYKFTEESAMTELVDITFNVGLFGRIAPVAQVKPIKLKGNTIENVSLGSVGRFNQLQLRKGDKVKILYDIIPYLTFDGDCEHDYNNDVIELPDKCPECGEDLDFTLSEDKTSITIASCNNSDCPCRIKGKILNYLNKMNIDGISYGIIDKLYDEGFVRSIPDLYKIKKHAKEIASLDGFGVKSVKTWIEVLDPKLPVADYMVFGALGIEGLSKKTFQKIFNELDIDELLDVVDNKMMSVLIKIPSIKDKTAEKLISGINDNRELIEYLIKKLDIIETKGINDEEEIKFTVCFTKLSDKEKKVFESMIKDMKGSIVDSITKHTTFLVVPSLETASSKTKKAEKYNIPIIPKNEFTPDIIRKYL